MRKNVRSQSIKVETCACKNVCANCKFSFLEPRCAFAQCAHRISSVLHLHQATSFHFVRLYPLFYFMWKKRFLSPSLLFREKLLFVWEREYIKLKASKVRKRKERKSNSDPGIHEVSVGCVNSAPSFPGKSWFGVRNEWGRDRGRGRSKVSPPLPHS